MKDGGHRTGGLTKSNLYGYEGQWSITQWHAWAAFSLQPLHSTVTFSDKNKTYTVCTVNVKSK